MADCRLPMADCRWLIADCTMRAQYLLVFEMSAVGTCSLALGNYYTSLESFSDTNPLVRREGSNLLRHRHPVRREGQTFSGTATRYAAR
eukprot:3584256-Prymnesium_polylepis.2